MTILYPAPVRVKRNRKFGAGLLASRPTYRAPVTAQDIQWWTVETATAEDAHYDRLADEAAFLDRYTRGLSD